jgi:hypothetical protein
VGLPAPAKLAVAFRADPRRHEYVSFSLVSCQTEALMFCVLIAEQ